MAGGFWVYQYVSYWTWDPHQIYKFLMTLNKKVLREQIKINVCERKLVFQRASPAPLIKKIQSDKNFNSLVYRQISRFIYKIQVHRKKYRT